MATQNSWIQTLRLGWNKLRQGIASASLQVRALLGFSALIGGASLLIWAATSSMQAEQVIEQETVEPFDSSIYAHSVKRNLSEFLAEEMPDTLPPVAFEPEMVKALYQQVNYLRRPDVKRMPVKGISKSEMLQTVERLQAFQLLDPHTLLSNFDFYRIQTDLNSDKVRITGYYTPVIKASKERQSGFQFPLYRKPKGSLPSAAAVWAGALAGQGLEIAWVGSKKDVTNAQLQGSCLIEFPDGKRQFLGFGGSTKEKGSYVFFTEVDEVVLGAGFFPVTAGYTLAVDTRFIPLGATLLAELPDIDPSGQQIGTTYRILFAQDKGGAIKTTKRVDLYSGIGRKGLESARRINRYARLWVMLPKTKKSAQKPK